MADDSPEFFVRTYVRQDEDAVIQLWRDCDLVVPSNDPAKDIAIKLDFQPDLFFVAVLGGRLVATVMVGYEGHRGWINYLAVDPGRQRRGLGRHMMGVAEEALRALGCPKINLQVRASNQAVIDFYERIGFRVEQRVSFGKRLDGKESGSRPSSRN